MKTAIILLILALLTALVGLAWVNHEIDKQVQRDMQNRECPAWVTPGTGDVRCP